MKTPKHTLVIVAFTTLVSCSSPGVPATMPDSPAQTLRLYATSATLPLVSDLTTAYGDTYTDHRLTFETRSGSFQTTLTTLLEGGENSYLFTTHLPSPDTLTTRLWAAPVGQDGIAVIVNSSIPVTGVSLDQLREIYQGRTGNWRDLGGQNSEMVIFSRETGSDTRAEFERLVMGSRQTTLAARLIVNNDAMVDAVAGTPGGIGYISMAFLNPRVRPLEIQGIPLTPATIHDNRYPLRSTIFVIGSVEPVDASRAFIGWIQSPEGQAVVARRYTPVSLPVPLSPPTGS